MSSEQPQFDPQLLERLAAEMQRIPIRDLLVQTIGTISSLAWTRFSGELEDLDQARLAIDALRALVPVVAPTVSEQAGRDLNAVVSSLQLAYVRALAEQGPPAPEATDAAPAPASEVASTLASEAAAAPAAPAPGATAAPEPAPASEAAAAPEATAAPAPASEAAATPAPEPPSDPEPPPAETPRADG
jgi:hypothetical protein